MLKMNDMDILELALHNQQTAWNILEHTGIIPGMGTYWGNRSFGRLTQIRSVGKE